MVKNGELNSWRKFFSSRWFLLVLLGVAILIAFAYGRAYYQDYQVRQEIDRLRQEVKRMEAKKIETIEMLKYVKSTAFIEEKARTELNLLKPGEKIAIINGGLSEDSEVITNTISKEEDLSNPAKWVRLFWPGLLSSFK